MQARKMNEGKKGRRDGSDCGEGMSGEMNVRRKMSTIEGRTGVKKKTRCDGEGTRYQFLCWLG